MNGREERVLDLLYNIDNIEAPRQLSTLLAGVRSQGWPWHHLHISYYAGELRVETARPYQIYF